MRNSKSPELKNLRCHRSLSDLARSVGVSRTTIFKWLKAGKILEVTVVGHSNGHEPRKEFVCYSSHGLKSRPKKA